MSKKPTMTDIAKRCGVSQTLVSFVLAGKDYGISDTTRQKVLDTASELGYKTRSFPSAKVIGVVIDRDYGALSLSRVLSGIYGVLAEAGYEVLLCGDTESASRDEALSRKALGYVLISANREAITNFSALGLPFSFVTLASRIDEECGEASARAVLDVIDRRAENPDKGYIENADIPGARSARRDSVWLL